MECVPVSNVQSTESVVCHVEVEGILLPMVDDFEPDSIHSIRLAVGDVCPTTAWCGEKMRNTRLVTRHRQGTRRGGESTNQSNRINPRSSSTDNFITRHWRPPDIHHCSGGSPSAQLPIDHGVNEGLALAVLLLGCKFCGGNEDDSLGGGSS
jgi:hypothetical protein